MTFPSFPMFNLISPRLNLISWKIFFFICMENIAKILNIFSLWVTKNIYHFLKKYRLPTEWWV